MLAVLAVLLCLFHVKIPAQKLSLRRYDVADGLVNPYVQSIYQDRKGFIWIGTREGLSRFDGYAFVNYGVRDGLAYSMINDIKEDGQGRLWAATNGGGVALLIDPSLDPPRSDTAPNQKFVSFAINNAPEANFVNRILFDSENHLWCLTDFGIYRASVDDISNLTFEPVVNKPSFASRGLIEDSSGRIWFSLGNELFEFKDGEVIDHGSSGEGTGVQDVRSGLTLDYIREIINTKDGRLLIATFSALYVFAASERGDGKWIKHPLSLEGSKINFLFEDSGGGLWIGIYGADPDGNSALIRFQNGEQKHYSKAQGIDYSLTWVIEDTEGNLWFGTYGGGVHRFSGDAFTAYSDGSSPLIALDIFEGPRGEVLAMRPDMSFVQISENDISPFSEPQTTLPLPSARSRSTSVRTDGADWIWTSYTFATKIRRPVIKLRDGNEILLTDHFSPGEFSQDLNYYEDEAGVVWFVKNFKDIYRLDPHASGKAVFITSTEKPVWNTQIVSDKNGGLWLGGGTWLCHLSTGRFACPQPSEGLPSIDPRSLFVDSRGWLWVGTRYNGVSVAKDPQNAEPKFDNYWREQGLVSDAVWFIAEDDLGKMYFATDHGLEQFDPSTDRWRHFNSKNGLSGDSIGSIFKDGRGNLWICTSSGLTKFDPRSDRAFDKAPPIYLSRVRIAGEDLPIAETGASELPFIELEPDRNNLAIEYVGVNFSGENDLSYQYKLEGVDADWSAPTKQRLVNFARLAAGDYHFLVRAVNREGTASTVPASFEFRLKPPIYLRWWFILMAIGFVGLVNYGAYRNRVRRVLEMERMRMRIATDLHDDIGANLTRISLLSEVARQHAKNEKVSQVLPSIADIARESVDSMNDIVWAISPDHDSLLDLTSRMRKHAEEVFAAREVDLTFNAPARDSDLRLSVDVRRDVLLIFKEAINNAARHSDCSQVEIDFVAENSFLRLSIKDDGKGIEEDANDSGHGLKSMARRAKAIGGKLKIDSQSGRGTQVAFEMPL